MSDANRKEEVYEPSLKSQQPQPLMASDSSSKDPEKQGTAEKFYESQAGDGTTVYDQYMTGVPLYLCFSSCFITMFLIALDQTIIMTILETVGSKFNAYDQIGWVASGYMLAMSVFAQTWGRLSIIFGRKYTLLVAIILFEVGSVICATANSMNMLIGGRVLAGIGGGGIQTLLFVVISEMVPINKRSVMFAILMGLMSIATVAGPLLGGAFTEHVSWRWCFYINLPLGGVAFIALTILYKPPMPKFTWAEKVKMVDYIGSFLLSSGLVLILLGLTMGGSQFEWDSAAVICFFIIGALVLVVFGVWNFKYSKYPIIPWSVVRVPALILPDLALFFTFFCLFSLNVYLSTYFQIILKASAMSTGVHFLPLIISMTITSIITGALIKKTRYVKPLAMIGGILCPLAMGLCSLLDVDSGSSATIGYLILPGVTIGLLMQSSMMSVQVNAPKEAGGLILSTAMVNFMRSLGGAIGSDLAQAVYNASVNSKGASLYANNAELFNGLTEAEVLATLANPSEIYTLAEEMQLALLDCIMGSIHNVFYMATGVAAIVLGCTMFYSSKMIPKDSDIQTKEDYEAERNKDVTESLEKVDTAKE